MKLIVKFLLLLLIYEIILNYESIFYITNSNKPCPFYIKNKVKNICLLIKKKHKNIKFCFTDIGSGNGDFLKNISSIFDSNIGIEINEKYYKNSIKNNKNKMNIVFINKDCLLHNYKNQPTIFYLYEPFYCIEKKKSIIMYEKLFNKFQELCLKQSYIYIIYITGVSRKDIINNLIYKKYNFYIYKKYKIYNDLLFKREIYVFNYKRLVMEDL